MSRITKEIASSVAKKLLANMKNEVDKLEKSFQQLATDEYRSYIPLDVINVNKEHPDWIVRTGQVFVTGKGFASQYINLTERLPSNNTGSVGNLNLTDYFASKLINSKNKWAKAKDKYNSVLTQTEMALLSLLKFSRVKESFPEAYKFLPSPKMPVVINIDHVRKLIKERS